jgi:hypothetical protein
MLEHLLHLLRLDVEDDTRLCSMIPYQLVESVAVGHHTDEASHMT